MSVTSSIVANRDDVETFIYDLYRSNSAMDAFLDEVREAEAVKKQKKMALISKLREEDEINASSSLDYSRSCSICFSSSPRQRSVFTLCGHSFCRACTEYLEMDAVTARRRPNCPLCRKESGIVTLIEQIVGKEEEEVYGPSSNKVIEEPMSHREQLIQQYLSGEMDEDTYTILYQLSMAEEACRRGIQGGRPVAVYVEEMERIDAYLPQGSHSFTLAAAAAEAARRRSKLRLIKELRAENEKNDGDFSRACGKCYSKSPRQRNVLIECGHVICRACAEEMAMERQLVCPFCNKNSETITIFEDHIEAEEF